MRALVAIALSLALSPSAQAQSPRRPHPFDRTFWAASAAYWGAATLDIETTRRGIERGAIREGNPLLKEDRDIRRGRAYLLSGAAYAGLVWLTHKRPTLGKRLLFGFGVGRGAVAVVTLNLSR